MAVVAPQATAIGRLLDQSTYGPTPALMDHVAQVGITAFLDEQLVAPESPWPPFSATLTDVVDAFFANAVNGQDQLRQRIIGALSEIFVIARSKNNTSSSEIIPWLSLLSRNAFGNYRTLLREITLDASMGKYLDLVNSGATGGAPNENYPRELMELFSLGVHVLNADGSPQVDGSGVPVPASQADVQNLARGLSGWTYGSAAGLAPAKTGNQKYYPGPMIPFIGKHDTSPKTLLGHAPTRVPPVRRGSRGARGSREIRGTRAGVGPGLQGTGVRVPERGQRRHNLIVPLQAEQYAAYQSARGVLALPTSQLTAVTDASQGTFGLPSVAPQLPSLFTQGKLAIVANVGVLAEPTTFGAISDGSARLPSNLRSHAIQIASIQTGYATSGATTGGGGRMLDELEAYNEGADFPVAISMDKPALYCSGVTTQDITLQPGNTLQQQGLGASPGAAGLARMTAQQQILAA